MRITPAVVVAVALVAARPGAQEPAQHPVSIADLLTLKQVAGPELSPDGRTIVYTVRGWENGTGTNSQRRDSRTHIWRVNADGSGGRQLTFGDRGESSPKWSPDGTAVAFTSARGGEGDDAPSQLWIMPADGGEGSKLTDSKESVTAYAWAPDGKRIAYVARDPLPKDADDRRKRRDDAQVFEADFRLSHLFLVDLASHTSSELVHDASLTVAGEPSWSPDGARVAFSAAPTTMIRDDRADVYILTVASKALDKITTNPGPDTGAVWSPDGATIAYLSSPNTARPLGDGIALQRVGNEHLMLYDVASRRARDVSTRDFDLSPGPLHWSADSRSLVFATGVKTFRDLFTFDVSTGKYARTTHDRIVTVGSVGKTGMSLVIESSSAPAEIFIADAAGAMPKKLTDTNPAARSFALGTTEVVSWKSDAFTIDGVLLKPINYQPGKRYPLMVVAHGGPTGAHMDTYRVGYGDGGENFAGEGWAVLYPNPRGSTGYGEAFTQANFHDWGGGDYRDIMTGVDAMIARGIADPDKLAFQGWSYGGYLTAWVVSQTPRFKAAMMGAGIPDLVSMYNTNDIPNYLGTFFGGIPSKETMPLYTERSAITYVDRVTTPLLILHGGSDQRVPIGQPMEYFRALKDRGKTVELVFYPREGHGFQEYYHQLDRMQRQHDWITKYTLGSGAKKTTNQ